MTLKRVFLLPNSITAFGLACGLFVIFKTSISDPSKPIFSLLQASAILLLIAAAADVADGAIARLIKAESEFGVQFDSLSDSVNFGVAPPLLILKSLTWGGIPNKITTVFMIIAAMIYTLCGVLRLVRFNVQRKKASSGEKKHFTGLPIPAAASCVLSAALILVSPLAEEYFPLSSDARGIILGLILVVIGYFMVSRWKFPSLKALHVRVPSFYLIFATGVFAVLILYGILDYFAEAYFAAAWLYVLLAWTLSLIRIMKGKNSKTLVDFEPEEEEGE